MIDRENVIENLEQNIRWIEEIECHQFPGWGNVTMAMRDALELLKEQKPIKPTISVDTWICSKCGHTLESQELIDDKENPQVLIHEQYQYCPNCGRAVKWDEHS